MKVIHGNSKEVLRSYSDNTFDCIVTDPPYELGFMGKGWDKSGIAYDVDLWKQCLRVLKPGGHLLSFGGSRTYHRMACAIEDAGFEIRDQIMWVYGSGFPKSLDISKAIDKQAGAEREVVGLSNRHTSKVDNTQGNAMGKFSSKNWDQETGKTYLTAPATDAAKQWDGWGTALKPAHEPICVARKPLSEKTVADNVLRWSVGGLNIDGCRVGDDIIITKEKVKGSSFTSVGNSQGFNGCLESIHSGRFPANLIHDGSDEVLAGFPYTKSGKMSQVVKGRKANVYAEQTERFSETIGDSGSASRFFYCAKASKADRGEGNTHPTVKPTELMRYLVRLVCPPGGLVLDPFAGSGSTLKSCKLEGFDCVGIELDENHIHIINSRLSIIEKEATEVPEINNTPKFEQKTLF